jgi:Family of unknown function (DUF6152)
MRFEAKALPTASVRRTSTSVGRASWPACAAVLVCLGAAPALAHHSYSMFDTTKSVFAEGTVAKVEWVNPHTFVWLYVERADKPGEYDLYGFENGPITMLMRNGWTKETLRIGEKVTIQYFPLKDGRTGGSFVKAIHADGTESIGDEFAPGVAEAAKLKPETK